MKQHKTVYANWWRETLHIMQKMGVDTASIIEQLPDLASAQQQGNNWLEVSMARQLWREVYMLTQDSAIGFKVGKRLSIRAFSVLAPVLSHSPTLADALDNMLRYQQLLSQSGQFHSSVKPGEIVLSYKPASCHIPIHYTQIDSVVAAFVKALYLLVSEFIEVKAIALVGPEREESHLYSEFFQCPIVFGATNAELKLAVFSPEAESINWDPVLYRLNKSLAEDRLWKLNNIEQLHASISEVIANQGYIKTNIYRVARELALSPRTLQRKLQQSGSSFRQIQEQLLIKEVCRLLLETETSIQNIALMLGYTETSSFSRAIKKMTGCSPALIRREYKTSELSS